MISEGLPFHLLVEEPFQLLPHEPFRAELLPYSMLQVGNRILDPRQFRSHSCSRITGIVFQHHIPLKPCYIR